MDTLRELLTLGSSGIFRAEALWQATTAASMPS
jgi:hypothetical protein